ncbi:hypothetical protein [Microvirga lotononidis]|uniref:Uncharacterized protein n=1 Tax=Microvirga lotononidis TaxID=864069 RepID=I4YQA2_9HYPH|nr:hypothetical protein [Microvirga lotononidis]EIM26144.1 hypothetical protein MicloDRAFT_00068760 [Microvirga lotononidis]WQO26048.1 hypothetical protein U0023_15185 [Microvirga lotononidis]
MALTGRFNLRKTFTGRIVLQVEEEVMGFWSRMFGKARPHRRWRDANVLDLAAPELRSLVDLRFRPRYMPQTSEMSQDWPKAERPLEAAPAQTLHYETYQEDGRFSTH